MKIEEDKEYITRSGHLAWVPFIVDATKYPQETHPVLVVLMDVNCHYVVMPDGRRDAGEDSMADLVREAPTADKSN